MKPTPAVLHLEATLSRRPELLARFAPGATPEALEAFQRAVGVPIPDDMLAFHAFRDGTVWTSGGHITVLGFQVQGLDQILETKRHWDQLSIDYETLAPEERYRRAHWALWRRDWVPLLADDHQQVALATEACFDGPPGQVICFDFKGGAGWTVEHDSYADWIHTLSALAEEELFDHHRVNVAVEAVWGRFNPHVRFIDQELPPAPPGAVEAASTWVPEPAPLPVIPFKPGDPVTITDGAFVGKPATFVEICAEGQSIRVELTVFGRVTTVDIPFMQVLLPEG